MGIRTEFLKSEIFSVMDSVRASAPNLKVVFQRLRGDPSLTNKSRREIQRLRYLTNTSTRIRFNRGGLENNLS